MHPKRPRLEVPLEPLDRVIEVLWLAALAWLIVPALNAYASLPDSVPTRYDFSGEPVAWGSKALVLALPLGGLLLSMLLWLVARYPHIHNFPFEITEENAPWAYAWSVRLLRALRLFITLTFAVFTYNTILIATEQDALPTPLLFIPILLSLFVPLIAVALMLKRAYAKNYI